MAQIFSWMVSMRCLLLVVPAILLVGGWSSAQTVHEASLQPGGSRIVSCAPGENALWQTPAEKTCYATTPNYAET
ncbi:MAG: hypothetical protein JWP98_798, partial [Edaphobacter sp.]|nr:hypothetical protein [Edaphobacter sp.]